MDLLSADVDWKVWLLRHDNYTPSVRRNVASTSWWMQTRETKSRERGQPLVFFILMHVSEWRKIHLIWEKGKENICQGSSQSRRLHAEVNLLLKIKRGVYVVWFILSLGFYQHPLRNSFCSFLPPNKVGGRILTRINNSRIFSPPACNEGELMFPFQKLSPPPPSCSHRESWALCPPCVVCGTCYPSNESRKDSQYSHTAFPSRLLE